MQKGDEGILFSYVMQSPYRFLLAAGLIAALLCLFPVKVDAPESGPAMRAGALSGAEAMARSTKQPAHAAAQEEPVHADLSARTMDGCLLHRTMYYALCGHSVQRREPLPQALVGLSRMALEAQLEEVIPRAAVTGFSSVEVDVTQNMDIPCPLHWVLAAGEDGMLAVMQNRMGETLDVVRRTDIPLREIREEERAALTSGRVFDDVQALEGYLESLSS